MHPTDVFAQIPMLVQHVVEPAEHHTSAKNGKKVAKFVQGATNLPFSATYLCEMMKLQGYYNI